MPITGKIWTGVIYREYSDVGNLVYHNVLAYDSYNTSPSEIATYYPSLSWTIARGFTPTELRFSWLPQCYPFPSSGGYASDEAGILDLQHIIETQGNFGTNLPWLRYKDGVWLDPALGYPDQCGTPATLWATYPLANTYNITTPAPFGTGLGNGLIKSSALYTFLNNDTSSTLVAGQYPNPPTSIPANGDTGPIWVAPVERTYIFTPNGSDSSIYVDGAGDLQTAPTADQPIVRAWGFSLDGHDFYVLKLGDEFPTLVFDRLTRQWSQWQSPGRTNWRPSCGINWQGMTKTLGFFSGICDVICGDDATGVLYILDPASGRDDRADLTTGNDDKFSRIVTGSVPIDGRMSLQCNALQITLALGAPTQTPATLILATSDDLGQTWNDQGGVSTTTSDFTQVVEWRSLGTASQPGRLFRITDDGATVRIGRAQLR